METVIDFGLEVQRRRALGRILSTRAGLPPPAISFWRRLPVFSPFQSRLLSWNSAFCDLVDLPAGSLRPEMRAEEIFWKPGSAYFLTCDTEVAHLDSMKLLCHAAESFHQESHSLAEGIFVHVSRLGRVRRCLFDAAAILVCGVLQEILIVEWLVPDSQLPYIVTGGFVAPQTVMNGAVAWHFLQVDPDPDRRMAKSSVRSLPSSTTTPKAAQPPSWKCRFCSVTETPMMRYGFFKVPPLLLKHSN